MKKRYIIITLAFAMISDTFCQTDQVIDSLKLVMKTVKNDTSLVNSMILLSKNYVKRFKFEEALQYADSALLLADRSNYKKGMAAAYNSKGDILKETGNYPDALTNYTYSLKINEERGDWNDIALNYNNIGVTLSMQGSYPEALKNFFSSLRATERLGDKKGMAVGYNNIALVFESQEKYTEALRYHFASLKIKEEIGDKQMIAHSYNNIGLIYDLQNNLSLALEYYFKALEINKAKGNNKRIMTNCLNIGGVYLDQGKYDEAGEYLNIALKISEETGNIEVMAPIYNNLGLLHFHLNRFPEARKYLEKDLAISKEAGMKEEIMKAYQVIYSIDSAEGHPEKALHSFQLYALYKDSVRNEENDFRIAQLEIQYQTEKKEQEIILLTTEKELKEQEAARQKFIRNLVIGGSLLMLGIGLLLFSMFRLRKKLEKHEALSKERKRISADLHDDVSSGLSSILMMSEMIKDDGKSPENGKKAEKISEISRELLSNIGVIIWALNTKNDRLDNLVAYIRHYAYEYFENSPVKLKLSIPDEIEPVAISGERRRNIFYTVKEALHNIIKHSQATEAELRSTLENNIFKVVIRDNGTGIPEQKINRFGNGMNNMQNRMAGIRGSFSIENHNGVKVTLSVPL